MKPLVLVASLCLAAPAIAQSSRILLVPQQFPEIVHAIAFASPGDVILVSGGTYLPFELTTPLTIATNGTARPFVLGESRVHSIPMGQVAALHGLQFQSRQWPDPNPNVQTTDNHALLLGPSQGTVMVRNCLVVTGTVTVATAGRLRPLAAMRIDDCPALLDQVTCQGRSGAHGLLIGTSPGTWAPVVLNRGSYTGGNADCGIWYPSDTWLAGDGIMVVDNQSVYLTNVGAFGGNVVAAAPFTANSTRTWKAGAGLSVEDGIAFVRSCTIQGGRGGTNVADEGGDGVHMSPAGQVFDDTSTLRGGLAGGPNGVAGQQSFPQPPIPRPLAALSLLPASSLVFSATNTLTVSARQNEAYILYLMPNFMPIQIPGILEPAFFGFPMIGMGTLYVQSGSTAQLPFQVQPDPNLIGVPLLFQAMGIGQSSQLIVAAPTASLFR